MKTHFTAEDIGKTFATSQEGVEEKQWIPIDAPPVVSMKVKWMCEDGVEDSGFYNHEKNEFWTIDPCSISKIIYWMPYPEIPSEADLLRKEIEELKASHEADLRTAVEMARRLFANGKGVYDFGYKHTPDEIIEKILKK
jgi:hypothetical protein